MSTIYNRLGINKPSTDRSTNLYDYTSSMKNNKIFFESAELKNVINNLVDSKYKASGESVGSKLRDMGSSVMEFIRKIIKHIREFFTKVKTFFIEKILKKKVNKAEENNKELRKVKKFPIMIKVNYKLVTEGSGDNAQVRIIQDIISLLERASTITDNVLYPIVTLSKIKLDKPVSDAAKKSLLDIDIDTPVTDYKNIIEGFDNFNNTFTNEINLREVTIEDKSTLEAYVKFSDEVIKGVKRSINTLDNSIKTLSSSMSDIEEQVNRFHKNTDNFNSDTNRALLNKVKDILTIVSTNVTKVHDKTMKTLKLSIEKVTIWYENVQLTNMKYTNIKE